MIIPASFVNALRKMHIIFLNVDYSQMVDIILTTASVSVKNINAAINIHREGTSRIHACGDTNVGEVDITSHACDIETRHVSLKQEATVSLGQW